MKFEVAIVQDIVLDDKSKYFKNAGEWNGVGTVYFKKVKGTNQKSLGFAKPYLANLSNFPLVNELIYIFSLPSPDIQQNIYQDNYYYITAINIWNSNHHNGLPNIFSNTDLPESQKRDYQQTQLGAVRRVWDYSSDINLGNTFQEKSNIKPVKKFEGDVVLEGRLGNSIRLGSTNQSKGTALNNWSTQGTAGDPILILRNGQGDSGSVGYLPTEENINQDPSSMYLTTSQKIPLVGSSIDLRKYLSYNDNKPKALKDYIGPQVIINSGRLVFNSYEDHLLLSSYNSIGLSSNNSVNIDTGDFIVQSSNIYLGSKSAKEPLLLGDTTAVLLDELIAIVRDLLIASQTAANSGGPIPSLNSKAPDLLLRLQKLQTSQLKSKYNYTV